MLWQLVRIVKSLKNSEKSSGVARKNFPRDRPGGNFSSQPLQTFYCFYQTIPAWSIQLRHIRQSSQPNQSCSDNQAKTTKKCEMSTLSPNTMHYANENYSHCNGLQCNALSKLHAIEPFKSYMEATSAGWVDQLWTKRICSSLLGLY